MIFVVVHGLAQNASHEKTHSTQALKLSSYYIAAITYKNLETERQENREGKAGKEGRG